MATAALAYKCMEVAYMRVICISHQSANRDGHELQTVLRIVPPGNVMLLCLTPGLPFATQFPICCFSAMCELSV